MKKTRKNATKPLDWKEAKKAMLLLESEKDYNNLILLAIGFYTGYRLSDILKMKYSDFADSNEYLEIEEQKTSKQRPVKILPELRRIVKLCQQELKKKDSYFIFTPIRYNSNEPIKTVAGIRRVSKAFKNAGLNLKKGTSHVLRKTFSLRYYNLAREQVGEQRALIQLAEMLNHDSAKTTRAYIGVSEKIEADIFANFA